MKRISFSTLSLLVAALPFWVSAALPYSNNFETADFDGQPMLSNSTYTTEWQGSESVVAVITNIDYSNKLNTPFISSPLEGTQSRVLAFAEGSLTNVAGGASPVVAIDTMIMPTFSQELQYTSALSNCQFGIAFTNGHLALYHGGYYDADSGGNGDTQYQKWTIFPKVSAFPGKWLRLTVTIDYAADGPYAPDSYQMLKIAVDGAEQTDASGNSTSDLSATNGGPWFSVAKWANGAQFNRMVLSGSGMMDDLSIGTSAVPAFVTPSNNVPYGWMTFMGTVSNGASSSEIDAAEFDDPDGDGMLNWQEFIAGTYPTNAASKLIIVSHSVSNGIPRIRWLSSTAAVAPYRIDATADLVSNNWTNLAANITSDGSGTNELALAQTTNSPTLYRVQVIK